MIDFHDVLYNNWIFFTHFGNVSCQRFTEIGWSAVEFIWWSLIPSRLLWMLLQAHLWARTFPCTHVQPLASQDNLFSYSWSQKACLSLGVRALTGPDCTLSQLIESWPLCDPVDSDFPIDHSMVIPTVWSQWNFAIPLKLWPYSQNLLVRLLQSCW